MSLATLPCPSLFGELTLVASTVGLRAALWPGERPGRVPLDAPLVHAPRDPFLVAARSQLEEWLAGTRTRFDLPLDPRGTSFQLRAWSALAEIPYGETATYGDQARRLGLPRAARAIGAANGRNPLSIVFPCHRLLGSDGALTGFAGGLEAKRALLAHEARVRARNIRDRRAVAERTNVQEVPMKAVWNGTTIAESDDTVVVEGNHYFPASALDRSIVAESDKTTVCPWKGTASYYSLEVGGERNDDAVWYYPEPKPEAEMVRDRVAFWKGVEVVASDEERAA